ncbi:MAG: SlyX family protein [Planctomycetota bacterium]
MVPGEDSEANARRLDRLEETVGFMDHTSGQLSDQIAAVSKEISVLSRRLGALERRLLDLTDAVTEAPPVVPPPHSAGPDVPRDPL